MSKFSYESMHRELSMVLSSLYMSQNISKALEFSYAKHQGQFREFREDSGARIPYIVHPVGVAIIAFKYHNQIKLSDTLEDLIMAALAHDLLEDTDVTLSELEVTCSQRTAEIVQALTKPNVKSGETHEERNIRFIKQIKDAGKTAMFIKICDSMHNMSRPQNSPPKLLKKAIKKSRRDYMTFFDSGLESDYLKLAYTNTINFAQREIQKFNLVEENKQAYSLNEAVVKVVDASERKVLELHDILEIIEEVTHPSYTLVDAPQEISNRIFFDITDIDQKTKAIFLKKMTTGSALLNDLPRKCRKDGLENIESLYFIETNLAKDNQVLALGYEKELRPDWVSLASIKMIFGYLSERLRASRRNHYIALSSDAAALGFNLTANELESTGIEHHDLINMNHLLNSAQYIQGIIDTEIQRYLSNTDYLDEILNIKKRLKEPRSIILKMERRRIKHVAEVDDIIGFRITCLNTKAQLGLVEKAKTFLEEVLPEKFNCTVKPNGQVAHNLVKSKAGYKARHLLYSIDLGEEHDFPVACEVQIRTIFEDAWAKFSNAVAYKKDVKNNKTAQEKLRELAGIRDKADSIADFFD